MTRILKFSQQTRRVIRSAAMSCALGITPVTALAMSPLEIPGAARETLSDIAEYDSYALPIGAFAGSVVPIEMVEGQVSRHVWKLGGSSSSTLQVVAPLRDQLIAAGYDIVFECADRECGGYDFRFGTDVASEPEMHVDLGDYRFLSAKAENDTVSLLVSRTSDAAFVQMIHVGPAETPAEPPATVSTKLVQPDEVEAQSEFAETLLTKGLAVLGDLSFKTGSSELEEGDFASLAALAGFLIDHPNTTILLVGHTDAEGSLEGNITLSKKRAEAVMERLVAEYMIPAERVQTDGVGFLAPRSSNQTEEGRKQNRRVEAVLTSIN